MSRYWSGLIPAAAFAATAALGAQGQNPANTPPPDAAEPAGVQRTTPSPSAQTRTDTVTIAGCLQSAPMASATPGAADRGSTTAADAPGRTTSGSAAGNTSQTMARSQFVLNAAALTAEGKAAPAPVGTSGTTATSYQLQGDVATLTPHLNHRVEITGTVQSSAASTTGAANARPGSTAAGTTLRVDSVKMLAETCDTGAATPAPAAQPRQP